MFAAIGFLWSLACTEDPPVPQRSFEPVDISGLGPCSCPGKGPGSSIWTFGLGKEEGQAVFVGLEKDCAVEVTGTYPKGGGPLPKETRVTAWGLDEGVHAVRCPDAKGRIRFPQDAPSCETRFQNAGEGPERFMVLTDPRSGRPSPFELDTPQSLDCALEIHAFAPGWTFEKADSVNAKGGRSVRLHWSKSATVNLKVLDRTGAPLAWKRFVGPAGELGTDAQGQLSFGFSPGFLAMFSVNLPPAPLTLLHRGSTTRKEVTLDVPTPIRVVFLDRARMPSCMRGSEMLGCQMEAETQTGLCYCDPERDGSTILNWSGGQLIVPADTPAISLDTRPFTGEVTGTLSGISRYSLRLASLDAPTSGINLDEERASKNEDGSFSFLQVAPGRYTLVSGIWPMETQHTEPFVVADGVVDVGELAAED